MKLGAGKKRHLELQKSEQIRSYTTPGFRKLTKEEAMQELRIKALPGDPGAEKLLRLLLEREKSHCGTEQRILWPSRLEFASATK